MKPVLLRGHVKDLGGGFTVRRLLPDARVRSVGPFVFFDHFGPVTVQPGDQHDVRPHPHIGLATVTYLFEGALMHRDSLGTAQLIEPGAVNWMTAGRGIVHSERRPAHLHGRAYLQHGLQLWVALPREAEEADPAFHHAAAADLPAFSDGVAAVRLLVGEAFGRRSPVPVFMPTLYLDIALPSDARWRLPPLAPQMALYPVQGTLSVVAEPDGGDTTPATGDATDALTVDTGTMAVLGGAGQGDSARGALLRAGAQGTRLALIGGAPLDGPRFMWWNFVSSRRERIGVAADDWAAGRFAVVPGETEFIPLPPRAGF